MAADRERRRESVSVRNADVSLIILQTRLAARTTIAECLVRRRLYPEGTVRIGSTYRLCLACKVEGR